MKPVHTVFSIMGLLLLIFVVRLLTLTNVNPLSSSTPWWVYGAYLGIVFSSVMYVYCIVEDKEKEEKEIEEEGQKILMKYREKRQAAGEV